MIEKNNMLKVKKEKRNFVSQSTITTTCEQIHSNYNIAASKVFKCQNFAKTNHNGRYNSILNEEYHAYSEISDNSEFAVHEIQHQNIYNLSDFQQKVQLCFGLENIFFKKKRYCFQILKQFYLFQDQQSSSLLSVGLYDPLIFQDQIIHTMVKILQTKLIQNKIWAFLNLKMRPYFKAAQRIEEIATQFNQKRMKTLKKQSFDMIKESIKINILPIQPISHVKKVQNPTYERKLNHISLNIPSIIIRGESQNSIGIEKKTQKRNNQISSLIISQKIIPTYNSPIKQIEKQMKVYPLQSPSVSDARTRVIKVNSSQNYYSPSITRVYSSIEEYYQENNKKNSNTPTNTLTDNNLIRHTHRQTQPKEIYKNVSFREPTSITYRTSQYQSPKKQFIQKKSTAKDQINKYNIIHYYEKPRQSSSHYLYGDCHHQRFNSFNSGQMSFHFKCSCPKKVSYCCQTTKKCCCQINQIYSFCCKERCKHFQHQKVDKKSYANTTFYSQKLLNMKSNISCAKSVQMKELTQLESRIEYLNFLKKIAKQNGNI